MPGLSHDIWIWTYIETNLLVICTAIPPLRVYFKRFLGHSSPHNTSKTPVRNSIHRRGPSGHSEQNSNSTHGESTESIVLHELVPTRNQCFGYQLKATEQPGLNSGTGCKAQKSQCFGTLYLNKELPPINHKVWVARKANDTR